MSVRVANTRLKVVAFSISWEWSARVARKGLGGENEKPERKADPSLRSLRSSR
jgi:hypothetical protein